MPASRSLALLLVAAGFATGCGATGANSSSGFSGTKKDVANAVEDLESAARKSDESKICTTLLTPELIASIRSASGGTCNHAISDALDDADTFDMTVESVTVSGTSATAVVKSKHKSSQDTFKLAQQGGRWKISSLG